MIEHAIFLKTYRNLRKHGKIKRTNHDSRIVMFDFGDSCGD